MEEKKRKKRGEEPRDRELHMRMTKSEMNLLEMVSYESEDSKTDVMRKALLFYVNAKRGSY